MVSEVVEEPVLKTIEKFVCHMYMKPKLDSVDDARFEFFAGNFKQTLGTPVSLSSLKNMDSSSWPPCSSELHQKILRTNLVSNIMLHSYLPSHSNFPPCDNGWCCKDQYYSIKWFDGDATPCLDVFSSPFVDDCENDSDEDFSGHCSSDSESNDDEM